MLKEDFKEILTNILSFIFPHIFKDERITRTIARSFAPDFAYHLEFPCPLLWTEPESDVLSLAEILETAEATLELWHQVPTSTLGNEQFFMVEKCDYLKPIWIW